jgi:hypothetical protein
MPSNVLTNSSHHLSSNLATQLLLEAATLRYQSEYKTAEANLISLLSNPVGIGEHTDFHAEIDKFIDQMASAQDRLDIIWKFRSQEASISNPLTDIAISGQQY